ncbi:hypothetical protein MYX76_16045 [Desulfobacterota bacterium AH_259_B03_O07]|nr:hypothetical protein [Desulfobacterota bacterium AH_259_B03_O07]
MLPDTIIRAQALSGIHKKILLFLCLDRKRQKSRLSISCHIEHMRDIYHFIRIDLSVALFLRDDNRYCHFLNTETSSAQATIFGMAIKYFSFRKGLMKKEIILKL